MAERKNHHYVPKFYFRRFSQDEKSICLLRREGGEVMSSAAIKHQASKNKFYERDDIEKALGDVEGQANKALKQLAAVQSPMELSEEAVYMVLVWVALQNARTVQARVRAQPMNDRLTQLLLEVEINKQDDLSQEEKVRMIADLPSIGGDQVNLQLMEMQIAMESGPPALRDLSPLLLENKTNRPVIFGDAPCVFYNAHLFFFMKLRGVLGYESPGLMVILPLSPKLLLILLDDGAYEVKRARANRVDVRDLQDVAALNTLQLHAAAECVYFHEMAFAPYVKALWSAASRSLAKQLGQVNDAPGFNSSTGEAMGDILHSFVPQLPYRLTLSFLKHAILGDGDSRSLSRGER